MRLLFRQSAVHLAAVAQLADKTLGHDGADGGGDQEAFDADVRQTGHGAGSVIGVKGGEYEVPRQGGVDGDAGCFHVSNFPDHDDVGSLAEHGAQGGGEGHADIRLYHYLVDAGEFVFHRVFHRDDFFIRAVDVVQARVKGRGFTGTGRTRHQDNAVRQRDEAGEHSFIIREKSELGKAQHQGGFVQDTHDDAFPVVAGDG